MFIINIPFFSHINTKSAFVAYIFCFMRIMSLGEI